MVGGSRQTRLLLAATVGVLVFGPCATASASPEPGIFHTAVTYVDDHELRIAAVVGASGPVSWQWSYAAGEDSWSLPEEVSNQPQVAPGGDVATYGGIADLDVIDLRPATGYTARLTARSGGGTATGPEFPVRTAAAGAPRLVGHAPTVEKVRPDTFRCSPGDWDGAPRFTYRFEAVQSLKLPETPKPVSAESPRNSIQFRVGRDIAADAGFFCRVFAHNGAGVSQALSPRSTTGTAPAPPRVLRLTVGAPQSPSTSWLSKGSVQQGAIAPQAGRLIVLWGWHGIRIGRGTRDAIRPGPAPVLVRATRAGRRVLARRHHIRVDVKAVWRPARGIDASRQQYSMTLTLWGGRRSCA